MDCNQLIAFKNYSLVLKRLQYLLLASRKHKLRFKMILYYYIKKRNEMVHAIGGERFVSIPRHVFARVPNPIECVAQLEVDAEFSSDFLFRFPQDLMNVIHALGFAGSNSLTDKGFDFIFGNRERIGGTAAFLIYIKRFTLTVSSLAKLGKPFGFQKSETSKIISAVADYLQVEYTENSFNFDRIGNRVVHLLPIFNESMRKRFFNLHIEKFSTPAPQLALELEHSALIFDGTVFGSSRPKERMGDVQRTVFDKRNGHSFNCILVMGSNSICYGAFGPSVGSNDLGIVNESAALEHFAALGSYKVIGDSIFHDSANIIHLPDTAETVSRNTKEVVTARGVRGEIEHYNLFKERFRFFNR